MVLREQAQKDRQHRIEIVEQDFAQRRFQFSIPLSLIFSTEARDA
jgi:hypothetical protein